MGRRPNLRSAVTLVLLWILACDGIPNAATDHAVVLEVPRGYVSRLEIMHEGLRYRFGPFVGYYFRPVKPDNLQRLNFVAFNEDHFYTKDLPANTKLFEGQAVFTSLPDTGRSLPSAEAKTRINPVFFDRAPQPWRQSRPPPREEYRHFHSCYNARGAVRHGYWLRHVAVADFTYDMGGRVMADSPLYHRVKKGVDRNFARILEFDRGPK